MRFLVDNQLPVALATLLRAQGHEAEHVLELGLAQGTDNPELRGSFKTPRGPFLSP